MIHAALIKVKVIKANYVAAIINSRRLNVASAKGGGK